MVLQCHSDNVENACFFQYFLLYFVCFYHCVVLNNLLQEVAKQVGQKNLKMKMKRTRRAKNVATLSMVRSMTTS